MNAQLRTLLIVDDSATDREILRRLLLKASPDSYKIIEAETASEVYALCQQHLPDCILLDYHLPGATGLEILKELVKVYGLNKFAVVMLSSKQNMQVAVEALKLGAHDFIVKGNQVQPENLFRAVMNAIGKVELEQAYSQLIKTMLEDKRHYEVLFNQTSVGIAEMDLNGYYIIVNDWFCEMIGYAREEIVGKLRFHDITYPDDLALTVNAANALVENGEPNKFEKRYLCKDGNTIWVSNNISLIKDEMGTVQSILAVKVDISSRKQAEIEREELSEFNRIVLENSQDCILIMKPHGVISYINPNGEKLMEITDLELFKSTYNFCELSSDDTRHVIQREVKKALSGETTQFQAFYPTVTGTPKWWDVMLSPIYDSTKKIVSLLSVGRDITQFKNLELDLENLLQAEQSLRQEAENINRGKDDFLAILSHELRTPLNALLGWSTMLKNKMLDEAKTEKALDVIIRNTHQLRIIIDDLLDVSRIISGKLKLEKRKVDLVAILTDSVESIRPSIDSKKLSLTLELHQQKLLINADEIRFKQLVGNLLTNSVKFTPESGHIHIKMDKTDIDKGQLEITDTGCGIEPAVLPLIFDRFKQANSSSTRRFDGLGLGLAIVNSLAELHDCRIWATSPGINKGATFTLEFPLIESGSNTVAEPSDKSANIRSLMFDPKALLGIYILVVDDDGASLEVLKVALEHSGARVTGVTTAKAAIQEIAEAKPDIVFSDIGMDEMDGLDLIKYIRAAEKPGEKHMPAIAMSGYASVDDREGALSAGFQRYIIKPIDIRSLPSLILELIKGNSFQV